MPLFKTVDNKFDCLGAKVYIADFSVLLHPCPQERRLKGFLLLDH